MDIESLLLPSIQDSLKIISWVKSILWTYKLFKIFPSLCSISLYLTVTFWNEYFWTHWSTHCYTVLHLFIGKAWFLAVRISLCYCSRCMRFYMDMHMYLHLHVIPVLMELWEYICILKVNFSKLVSQTFLILNITGQRF